VQLLVDLRAVPGRGCCYSPKVARRSNARPALNRNCPNRRESLIGTDSPNRTGIPHPIRAIPRSRRQHDCEDSDIRRGDDFLCMCMRSDRERYAWTSHRACAARLKRGALLELDTVTGAVRVPRVPYCGEAPAEKIRYEVQGIRRERPEHCNWRILWLGLKSLYANRTSRRAIHPAAQTLHRRTRRPSPRPQRDAS
jgi:hypothetical protein